jgi:hypothetical protein
MRKLHGRIVRHQNKWIIKRSFMNKIDVKVQVCAAKAMGGRSKKNAGSKK